MRADRSLAVAIAFLLAIVFSSVLSAHRRDEYLQAARIRVEPDRLDVELDLTPGIDVADGVIAAIDRDRDGALSEREQQEYVNRTLEALAIDIDGRPLRVRTTASTFPEVDSFRRGEGTMQLRLRATLPSLPAGTHSVRFRNSHAPGTSAYLANALVPASRRVGVTRQQRDAAQRELTIDFVMRSATPPLWVLTTLAGVAGLAVLLVRRG